MTRRRAEFALVGCLLMAMTICLGESARAQEQQADEPPAMTAIDANDRSSPNILQSNQVDDAYEPAIGNSNSLGAPFLKNLLSDQKAIWTSPAHLRWADGTWLFPLTAVTWGLFATDRAVTPTLSTDMTKLNRYTTFSNYGVYSMVGAGGGLYLWSNLSHDDHQRETHYKRAPL